MATSTIILLNRSQPRYLHGKPGIVLRSPFFSHSAEAVTLSRTQELNDLVDQYLLAETEDDPIMKEMKHDIYQDMLILARPTQSEFDWINREVSRRKIQNSGAVLLPKGHHFRDPPTRDIITAFRDTTPMSGLYRVIRTVKNWNSDDRNQIKAYIMACFSEIAYLHLTEHELAERDRYKIFSPSIIHSLLLERGPRMDLATVMLQVADIPIKLIETGRFLYVIYKVGNFVVIAVRGTVDWRDWWLDSKAHKDPGPHGFYHRGFQDEAKIALPLLLAEVGDQRPLYITGHSLGGAVASILSIYWRGPRPQTPYVFASPRFGTPPAALGQPRYVYVRPADLVPHLPPRFMGYSDHGGQFETLPVGEKRRPGWRVLYDGIVGRLNFAAPHSMEAHRALLGAQIGEPFDSKAYAAALEAVGG